MQREARTGDKLDRTPAGVCVCVSKIVHTYAYMCKHRSIHEMKARMAPPARRRAPHLLATGHNTCVRARPYRTYLLLHALQCTLRLQRQAHPNSTPAGAFGRAIYNTADPVLDSRYIIYI